MSNIIELAKRRKSKALKVDKPTYELWKFSGEVDTLLQAAIVEKSLSLDETATVLAHRLGTLIALGDEPEKLMEFCQKVLARQVSGPQDTDPEKAI